MKNSNGQVVLHYVLKTASSDAMSFRSTEDLGVNGTILNGKYSSYSFERIRLVCDKSSEVMKEGETLSIRDFFHISPRDAGYLDVEATSSNPDVAFFNGRVSAAYNGTATFEVKASQYDDFNFNIDVTVVPNHEYVDLGLPSGTLWATCNIGADSPEEVGDYFSWGDTGTKTLYDLDHYKFYWNGKYYGYVTNPEYGRVDGKTILTNFGENKDDAAAYNWNWNWKMPTSAQFYELRDNCLCRRTHLNGKPVIKFKSKINGKTIVIPYYGGYLHDGYDEGNTSQRYWTNSGCNDRANFIQIAPDSNGVAGMGGYHQPRYYGCTVRPVRVK